MRELRVKRKRKTREEKDTGTIESWPQQRPPRGDPEHARSASQQPPRSRSRPRPATQPAPAEGRQRAGSRHWGTGTCLPLSDVKCAGAEALAVQHSLGLRLLLPEPLSRARRRETFEEAHCSSERGDRGREGAEALQPQLQASPRPGSGGNHPGRAT